MNSLTKLLPALGITLILTACGGGSSTSSSTTANEPETLVPENHQIGFAVASKFIKEGSTISFSIVRSNSVGQASVIYSSQDGTAVDTEDYQGYAPSTLIFADGEVSKVVRVRTLDDTVDENLETFELYLTSPSAGYTLNSQSASMAKIIDNDAAGNQTPTISGNPAASAIVGNAYNFTPQASDPDGDTLSFDVQNAPAWLAFNAINGSLSGTPTAGDIGTDENIIITASDGTDSATIGPFSIVVNDVAPVQPQTKKFNPGHYIDLLRYQTTSAQSDSYITDAMRPGVTGVQVRYYWRDLETSPGVYDFSRIEHDLELVSSQGMHLIINPADKTFKNALPVPDYLTDYLLPNRKTGYSVKRWDPYVVDRWVALMEALGKRFDSNPYFEAIATEESALGIDDAVLTENGYTPEIYRDTLIDMLQRTAEAFPTTRTFWYMNFFPMRQDYIAQVASAIAPYDAAMGGPDILPDNSSIARLAYPFYDQFKDTMKLFCVAMPDSYKHEHKDTSYETQYWTMQELFEYGRDKLHLNYVLWTSVPNSSGAYDTYDAYPVIESNPAFNL